MFTYKKSTKQSMSNTHCAPSNEKSKNPSRTRNEDNSHVATNDENVIIPRKENGKNIANFERSQSANVPPKMGADVADKNPLIRPNTTPSKSTNDVTLHHSL